MERLYKLRPQDTILLAENPDGGKLKEWKIDSIVGEGSFSVCYYAQSGDRYGRLKEFYPFDNKFLKRNENNHLVTGETFVDFFLQTARRLFECLSTFE